LVTAAVRGRLESNVQCRKVHRTVAATRWSPSVGFCRANPLYKLCGWLASSELNACLHLEEFVSVYCQIEQFAGTVVADSHGRWAPPISLGKLLKLRPQSCAGGLDRSPGDLLCRLSSWMEPILSCSRQKWSVGAVVFRPNLLDNQCRRRPQRCMRGFAASLRKSST
jgi:hypothetical protein